MSAHELTNDETIAVLADTVALVMARIDAKSAAPVTVYVDCETGGTAVQCPTIQIASVAMRGDSELGAFEQKIAFDIELCEPEALAMNHYTAEAWADAVSPGIAASRLAAWIRPYCEIKRTAKSGRVYTVARWAGYNVSRFDGARIRALFSTHREFLARDVLQRALFYFDETGETPPENFKLSTVAAHFGIATDGAHDALFDARLCAQVHHRLLQEVGR